ncbi:histidine phosphatase family protein [Enterococcus sp. HY326]|uniref:histidine phosphatase family protein n=1 Tax=Enterococcus sp. HY326 TaxID=2971265 RepID=UPI0022409F7F|nr:histidine phosphatase family protein [Enterococcus sp. HY326]
MELILIRHGESLFNQANRSAETGRFFSGQSDTPLTEKGQQQARELKKLAIFSEVNQIYTSPLSRAYETARLAMGRQDIILDERLKERSLGILDGKNTKDLPQWQDFLQTQSLGHSFIDKPPGGENYADVEKRVGEFLRELTKNSAADKIAIFSHFVAIRLMIKLLLNLDEEQTLTLKIKNSHPLSFRGDSLGNFIGDFN